MEKVSENDIEWLLQPKENFQMGRPRPEVKSASRSKKKRRGLLGWTFTLSFFSVSLLVLPFFILIRTAVYLNVNEAWNGWVSLLGGMGACVIFLSILFFILFRKVKNKKTIFQLISSGVSLLVGGFIIYGLLYLSSVNAKSDSVREVYRSLHPILRVAIATTTLADGDLVITDIQRTPEDYIAMGLTPRQSSMHYTQPSGFVHAIDLRTIGHSELRNNTLEWSLKLLGFQTIRHVGTADHLHIALPISY